MLNLRPDHLLIDALRLNCDCRQTPIIHGDALSASIAAASIIAKVERDAMISAWDPVFPEYRLASNKGYSTPHHLKTLREKGPDAAASAVVRAGVDVVGAAGSAGVHAGGGGSNSQLATRS